ncbi:MAG: methyl-accepting chemotaxis protein, partial [Ligilactobacillus ruminis]|nr:methyl-accepting chemotaxis protein [Ligilactobacillus ruminis]
MVRKRQKTIGNYIIWILLAVGLIPLIVMVLATYDTTSDLLMARNDSAKLSAVNVVQTERSKLQKQSEHVLKKVAGYPEISGGKYDEKIIKTQLDRAKDACQYIQSIVVGYSDNKYVSTQLEPADYKVTSRPWYTKAVANEGQICWTSPYKSASMGKYLVTASYAMRSRQGKLIVVSVNLTYESVEKTLKQLKIGNTGRVTLVSKTGIVLASKGAGNSGYKEGKDITSSAIFKAIKNANARKGTIHLKGTSEVTDVYYDKGAVGSGSNSWAFSSVRRNDLSNERMTMIKHAMIVAVVVVILILFVTVLTVEGLKAMANILMEHLEQAGKGHFKKIPEKFEKASSLGVRYGQRIVAPKKDGNEFSRIANGFNEMVEQIGGLLEIVKSQSDNVAEKSDSLLELSKQTGKATEEVAQTITGIAEVTSSQAQETHESVTKLEELSKVIDELNESVQTMNAESDESAKINQDNMNTMDNVNSNWVAELDDMKALSQSVQNMNAD